LQDQTQAVLEAGALPHFVRLLEASPCPFTPEQCAWALGNVAGDGPAGRDAALAAGTAEALVRMFGAGGAHAGAAEGGLVKQCAWLASNLYRFKPHPRAAPAVLPILARWAAAGAGDAAQDAVWALAYITENDVNLDAAAAAGVLPAVAGHLSRAAAATCVTPALRVFGNFCSGSEAHTDAALNCGLLRHLPALLERPNGGIRKEALWALSNIVGGTAAQAQRVDEEGLWPAVLQFVAQGDRALAREALWAVSNNFVHGAAAARRMVGLGALGALKQFLKLPAPRACPSTVRVALEGLGRMLGAAAGDDAFLALLRGEFEESGLGDAVYELYEERGDSEELARAVLEPLENYILEEA